MRIVIILVCALLGASFSYWVYRGIVVMHLEFRDFASTSDNQNESARARAAAAAAAAQVVNWQLPDGSRQRAFFLPPRNGRVVVYAHGAPGAASTLLPEAQAMARHGIGALLLDLPGYGESEGERNWGPKFSLAIRRAVDFVAAQPGVDARRIGGFGYSMGGFAMARAAAEDKRIAAVVLLATFTNLTDQLHAQFRSRIPGISYFALAAAIWSGVPVKDMDTRAAVRGLANRPLLVVAGARDRAIPGHMARELRQASANGELWIIDEVGHSGFAETAGEAYFIRLREFWEQALVETRTEGKE